jgi:7-carboxy-7-deazaguanine synthase
MAKQIIPFDEHTRRKYFQKSEDNFLRISEFYFNTIQGEGINAGVPAAFLRMQNCTMNCVYCDTTEVWRHGSPYSFPELLDMIDKSGCLEALKNGQHLVLTGGSPLLQEEMLVNFFNLFERTFQFLPYIEIENECTLMPGDLRHIVNCWNNSPKLTNSGTPPRQRYQPNILRKLAKMNNSWFKFVLQHPAEWKEVEEFFLKPDIISREQIILMPEGQTRAEVTAVEQKVIDLAIQQGVRYSTRQHIILWDRTVGV